MKIIRRKPGINQYKLYTLHDMILSTDNISKWFAQLCAGIQPQVTVDEEVLALMEGHGLIRKIDDEWTLGHEGREFARKLGLRGDISQNQTVQEDLTKEDEQTLDNAILWQRFHQTRDNYYRNLLMEYYRDTVRYAAERLHNKLPDKVELDDLISAGTFGLMDAIDAYDPECGIKFEAYCAPRIKGSILDELRNMDWVLRLVKARIHKMSESSEEQILDKHDSSQTLHDMRVHRQASLEIIEDVEEEDKNVYKIDVIKESKSTDPIIEAQKYDLKYLLTKGFSRTERLIIILYYYEEMTMKEIGNKLDLSESHVSQMHSSIVARLKAQLGKRSKEFSIVLKEPEKVQEGSGKNN